MAFQTGDRVIYRPRPHKVFYVIRPSLSLSHAYFISENYQHVKDEQAGIGPSVSKPDIIGAFRDSLCPITITNEQAAEIFLKEVE